MKNKEYSDLALKCSRDAAAAGCDEAEVFLVAARRLAVSANGGQVENIVWSNPVGLGLRVIKDKRQGFVFSSDFRAASLATLASKAVFLAGKSTPDDANGLPDEVDVAGPAGDLRIYDSKTTELDPDEAIAQATRMEKAVLAQDKRVKGTDTCRYSAGEDIVVLADSRGQCRSFRSTSCALVAEAVAQDACGPMQSAFHFSVSRFKDKLESPEEIGAEAARKAVSLLGAETVKTQRVPVVLSPEVAASWIGNVYYALDGEEALKNTTFLSDKLNTKIASPLVSLVDDGIMVEGIATSPFDGEGVPTARNVVIDQGVCKKFIYNTYSARRAGVTSTGNASRGYDSPPGVGSHNLYLKPGESSPEEIIASVKNGLYVMSTGAFGFNGNTGDYSYEAAGLWIKDGALASPVHELTIASNSLDMLAAVEMVGNDLRYRGSVNSPTMKIAEMAVGGRQG
jgi:PmbA protein